MRVGRADWAGRVVLDLGCGTGFHLPRFAATAARVFGVEPHPGPGRAGRRGVPGPLAERHACSAGTAQALPLPGRVGRRRARALGLLLRPGLRARPGRARPRRTPRRHGVRDRQRRHAARRSGGGSGAATRRSTRSRSSGSGRRTAGPARRSTSTGVRQPRRPGGRRPHRVHPRGRRRGPGRARRHRGRLRRQPLVATVLRPTVAPSSAVGTTRRREPVDAAARAAHGQGRGEQHAGADDGRVAEQALERADDLDGDLLERLAHRGEAAAARPGRPGSRRSRRRRCPGPGGRPRSPRVCSTPMARVSEAQTNAEGCASSSSTAAASRPLATVSSTREARPVVGGRGRAWRGSSPSAGPRRCGSPCASRSRRSGRGPGRAGGRWPARRRPRRRRRPTGGRRLGSSHGRPNATNGARRCRQPGGLRVAEVGVGDDERVDGGRAQQVVVPAERRPRSSPPANSRMW